MPNLSALNFICSADSSPETYRTLPSPCTLSQSCKIKVDLPIPGSPPSRTSEPLTKPPPNTLSNSPIPVCVRIASFPITSFKDLGVTFFLSPELVVSFEIFSS